MISLSRKFNAMLLILASFLVASSVNAFTVTSNTNIINNINNINSINSINNKPLSTASTSLRMNANDIFTATTSSTTSNTIAAATVDPTTALTQVLGAVLNTPLILVVPIVAAIGVASLIAWFIVSYANPTDPDE